MAIDHGKLLARFLQEAREHCARINGGLVSLEQDTDDAEVMNEVYRSAHTIKGAARMMKLASVATVAHRMEDLLDALKNGKVPCDRAATSLLFRGIDAVSGMLERVAQGGVAPGPDEGLCAELERAAAGAPCGPAAVLCDMPEAVSGTCAPAPSMPVADTVSVPGPLAGPFPDHGRDEDADREAANAPRPSSGDTIRISSDKLDGLIRLMGEVAAVRGRFSSRLARLRDGLVLSGRLLELLPEDPGAEGTEDSRGRDLRGTVRELHGVLAEAVSSLKDDFLSQDSLTRELLESSLALRTLPLSTVFDTFPRTVRDMALNLGKEIEFTVDGGETELDKVIIEKIGDPLLHMIRNAVDHGIEPPGERLLAGKSARGEIRLSAWYDGGSVTVAVRDDGRGIPLNRVRAKALQKKIVDPETLDALSDAEVTDLIFLPGFSTSEIVTDLSGRGVGLDVVRKNIVEELRGGIRIDSREGRGTALYLKLPLNLALSRLLFVSAADGMFALLADCVEEVITVSPEQLITVVHKKALRLRNEVIPVEELAPILGLPGRGGTAGESLLIVIVAVGSEKLGLAVDGVVDEESAVVKPLPSHLKGIRLVAGVTVRDSRRIVPLLSVAVLCAASREKKSIRQPAPSGETRKELTVLVVDDSISTREIEKSIIEAHGYQVVVAGDGLEALEKTRERIFDVVVTDIEMPRLDGFSLTEKLRSDDRYRHTPIIIVTSREREEDRRRGILVGANAYIVKGSFDQTNLIETIENLVA